MTVYITRSCHELVREATLRGVRNGIEYGGSLLAVEPERSERVPAGDGTLLVYAVPTGPQADQGPGHLRTDADFQNAAIARARARHPMLSYVGDWHVHPMFMPRLSTTDLRTAREILDDRGRDHLVLVLGTADHTRTIEVRAFVVTPCDSRVRAEEVELRVVPDDAPRVGAALGPRALLPLTTAGEPDEEVADPGATEHIVRELRALERRLDAPAKLMRDEHGLLGATLSIRGKEVTIIYPPEYPFGAPIIMIGERGVEEVSPVPLLHGWSSLHELADVVVGALDEAEGDKPSTDPVHGGGTPIHRLARAVRRQVRFFIHGREVWL